MPDRRLIWSEEALQDMEDIYNYYLSRSPATAVDIYNKLLDEAKRLLTSPRLGRRELILIDEEIEYRSIVAWLRTYKIIYVIEGQDIYVTHVWDCRQNPKKIRVKN